MSARCGIYNQNFVAEGGLFLNSRFRNDWEQWNKKASVKEIPQHTLINPLKSGIKTGTWFRFITANIAGYTNG